MIFQLEQDVEILIFAQICAKDGFDFSFLRTIPGNIGGAVKMNAGCYGSYISDYLIGLTLD